MHWQLVASYSTVNSTDFLQCGFSDGSDRGQHFTNTNMVIKKRFPMVQMFTIKKRKVFFLLFLIGAGKGIKEVFPDVSIKCCVFHWTQAVWRLVQVYSLVRTYRERQPVYWYIGQLLGLPFLPSTHIRETFGALRVRANTDPLMRLVDYIDR